MIATFCGREDEKKGGRDRGNLIATNSNRRVYTVNESYKLTSPNQGWRNLYPFFPFFLFFLTFLFNLPKFQGLKIHLCTELRAEKDRGKVDWGLREWSSLFSLSISSGYAKYNKRFSPDAEETR